MDMDFWNPFLLGINVAFFVVNCVVGLNSLVSNRMRSKNQKQNNQQNQQNQPKEKK